jgi:RNA polymerase sigma factor (sigma-70 family)
MSTEPDRIWNSFKRGDWDAYTRLYDSYYKALNNYGYKFTGNVSLIEDAIHDLFVTLWTSRKTLGEPASVRNYLYKAFRNTLFRKLKSASRFTILDAADYHYTFDVAYEDVLIVEEEEKILQQTIKDIVQKLPARQQEIVYLRFYEGLLYEEIAEVMSIEIQSVYKLWYKTVENLKQAMHYLVYCGVYLFYNIALQA